MMLEQSLINPNFIGRDGFRWFLGLIAKDTDQYQYHGSRAKVRILGHHGDDISDTDLPWAHVLVPLTMGSGTGGAQMQGTIKPSSLVVGFFADGDDGQQPIIIGAFYNGAETEFPGKFADGSKYFKLYNQQTSPINPYNVSVNNTSQSTKDSTGSTKSGVKGNGVTTPDGRAAYGVGSTATLKNNAATEALNQGSVVNRPGHCKTAKTGFNKILNLLKDFIKVLNTVNQTITGFVNPILNTISNIGEEIKTIATLISDWISVKIKLVRDKIINEIYKQLKKVIDSLKLPPWLEKIKQAAMGKLTDGIWCAIGKILNKITSFVTNFLFGLIGNIVSIPLCAAEAFIASAIQTITDEITSAIQPILDQVTSILGGPIGTVISYVNQAIGYSKGVLNFLICDNNPCKEYFDYEMNKGFIPQASINGFQKTINYSYSRGVSNLLEDADKGVSDFLGPKGPLSLGSSNCNVLSFECGPPTVSIFGGDGSGASGNAVVDALGGILGVNITNPGSGYSSPPYVRFDDSCDNGRGAYGIANIGAVSTGIGFTTTGVISVTMYYPGSGYLGPSTITDPCNVTPFDETGSPVTGTIKSVFIKNTGIGYSVTDKIYDAACSTDVEMYPVIDDSGRIIDVNIINPGTSINITPNLQINSENGFGAVLITSLAFNPISGITTETSRQKIKTVVYCAEDYE